MLLKLIVEKEHPFLFIFLKKFQYVMDCYPIKIWWQLIKIFIKWLGRKLMTNLDSILKSRYYFADKSPCSQSYGFSSSHVWMWELNHKESWALKNWCFWTVELEKTLESPLDCQEIHPVHPKGNQSWIFTRRADAGAEAPTFWPPDGKNWFIWKDPDAGKD